MDTISFGSIIRSIKKAKWLFVINAFIAIAIGVTVEAWDHWLRWQV